MVDWSNKWSIKFNESKCKVMHIGKNNAKFEYQMNNSELSVTDLEKDLGILVSSDLEWSQPINTAVGRANRQLGLIKSSFQNLNEFTMKLLYKSLVRPHLEYGAAIWSPYWHYDIDKLEANQRRATRIETLRGCSYEERLRKLNLPTLKSRRRRGDLIQIFKIVKGKDNVNFHYQPQKFELDLGRGRHDERIRMQLTK